ncbi:MAG: tandem-95 repeat protein, partial [Acidobacteria bacterium]|nr:tandem-95 repeat protein [Acidobacteriota bacterium]
DGNMVGVDVILTTTVDKTAGLITQVDRSVCVSGVFGPPEILSNSPVMIGTGLGLDGTDVVETDFPLNGISTAPNVRVGFLAESISDGAQDAVLVGNDGQDLIVFVYIPVPILNVLGTILLLVLLLGVALFILHKNKKIPPASSLAMLLLLGWTQAGIRKDGNPEEWQKNGLLPLAIDTFGDNANPDLRAVYGCTLGGSINFRFDSIMNQAPTADDQNQSSLEDQVLGLTLTGLDPEGQPITFEIVQVPSQGSLQNLTQGVNQATVDYVPNPDYFGPDTFTFRTFDGISYSQPATVDITLGPVNDPPTFVSGGNVSIFKDQGPYSAPWASLISPGPSNESTQTVQFAILTNDNPGLFSAGPQLSPSGVLSFTNTLNTNGTANLTVQLQDDGGTANGGIDLSNAISFSITIGDVNDPPSFTVGPNPIVLEDSGAQTQMNWATNISPGPPDEAGQTVSFSLSNDNNPLFSVQPAVDALGTLTFTPAPNANGSANVQIVAVDDGGTANGGVDTSPPQAFTISVTPVNDPPTFTLSADPTALEDGGPQSLVNFANPIAAGPSDESSQSVSFMLSNDNNSLFSVQPSLDSSGTLSFTAEVDANGSAMVTVIAMDDGGTANGGIDTSASQTFNLTITPVNDVPSFVAGADVSGFEDDGLQTLTAWATAISTGPPNESSQSVSFILSNNNVSLFAQQPAINSSGDLTFTPAPDANGSVMVMVQIMDDGGTANGGVDTSNPQTFNLTLTPVNDPPSFTLLGDQTVLENTGAANIASFLTNLVPGPADEAGQSVALTVTNDNNGLFSVQPNIDGSGTLTFTPTMGMVGSATVMVSAMDDGGTANGGINTSPIQTFTITVAAVNDPPSFTAGPNQSVLEDSGLQTVMAWATAISPGPPDEAGQTVSFIVTNNNNALFATQPAVDSSGTLTFTPAADANGTALVSVTAMDDGGTAYGGVDTSAPQSFMITVNAVNDAPSFVVGPNQSVLEDSGAASVMAFLTFISPGPADESAQTVTFSVNNDNNALFSVQPSIDNTGALTFTPVAGTSGSAMVMVTAMDDGGTANGGIDTSAPQTFTITVIGINDPPSFTAGANETVNEDAGAQTVLGWATSISPGPPDEAGQTVTFMLTNDNNGLFATQPAVNSAGTLTYTPAPEANGTTTVMITAMDDGGTANGGIDTSAAQSFTITVNAVNDAPSFSKDVDPSVLEDSGAATYVNFLTSISPGPADESGQTVSFAISNDNPGLFSSQPAIDASGTLTFTPVADASGSANLSVTAMDDGGTANGGMNTSAPQSFTITIMGINDPPSFTAGSDQTVMEDAGPQSVMNWATAISPGPADEAGQTVSFLVSNNNMGLFSTQPAVSASGTLSFTTALNANGSATVMVTAMDSGGTANGGMNTSPTQSFMITVSPVNDPPTAIPFQATYNAHTNMAIDVPAAAGLLVSSTDVEMGTTLSMDTTPINVSMGAAVTLNADGSFMVNPPAGFTGTISFDYRVSDDGDPAPGMMSAYTTVQVDVSGPVIWFADDDAMPGGNGTLATPFQTLAAANTAANASTMRIFLFSGSYVGGVTLTNGVQLIGQGAGGSNFDTLFAITPPANTITRPAINGTRPVVSSPANGINLGMNNTLRGLEIANTTGTGLVGNGLGNLTVFECAITGTGGALDLANGTLFCSSGFSELSSSNSSGVGISLDSVTGALSNSTNSSVISAPMGTAFSVTNCTSLMLTWTGTITKNNGGRVLNFSGLNGGTITLPGNISASHSGSTGILFSSNSGVATVNLDGASLTLNTGANTAITMSGNGPAGNAVLNLSGGGLDIDTTSGGGITAGGGTLRIMGSANTIDTATGIPLSIAATQIFATLRSVSANGAANGIVLNDVIGDLTITGTGLANSGGTLQNLTQSGISLTNTENVSFTNMRILNTARSGIMGTQVYNFAFINGSIDNSGTDMNANDSNIAFNTTSLGTENNLRGTVTITGNTLSNAYYHGIDIFNFDGTLADVTISNNTITSTTSAATSKGSGIRLIAFGSATSVANITKATLDSNVIRNFPSGVGLQVQGGNANAAGSAGILGVAGNGTNIIAITNNRISGQSAVNRLGAEAIVTLVNGKGQGNFNISNNGTAMDPIANSSGSAITNSAFGLAVVTSTINNNFISANNTFGAQGIGVGVDQVPGIGDTPDLTVTINGNSINNTDGNGILAVARNSNGSLKAKIQNNTVAAPLAGFRPGIRVDSGTATGNTTVCLNISGNTSAGSGGSQGIGLRKQGSVSTTNAFAVNGMAATSTPGVEAYIDGLNPAGGGTLLISATSGFTNCSLP